MKRHIILAIITLFLPLAAGAQTTAQLWKKYEMAMQKDKPLDALGVLRSISDKALAEREWGHLIKAEFAAMDVQASVTPDSLPPMLAELERKAVVAEKVDPVLAAVYNTCLGKFYAEQSWGLDLEADTCKARSQRFFAAALKNKALLADSKARNYEPLLVEGDASAAFGNDLLHVVAFEAKEYSLARQWYDSRGNRAAACLSALYQVEKERYENVREMRRSKYMATLDSLMHVHCGLPEAGEIAIEYFNFMDQATDASAQEKVEYIDNALRQWPAWPRMAVLRNARSRITLPSFHVYLPETTVIPGKEIPVYITSLVNLSNFHMSVTKLRMTGADEFNPQNSNDMKVIRSMKEGKPVFEADRVYYGLPDYKSVNDTLKIKPLPMGVYLVEFTTDNNQVPVERCLLHVTNLRLIDMDMPDNQVRLIVTDATTGKPVGGAKITIQFREWKSGRYHENEETLTTESNGEVSFSSTLRPYRYRVTTASDKAMRWHNISTTWIQPYKDTDKQQAMSHVYTDRAIYRPGQEVKIAVVAFSNGVYNGENNVLAGEEVEVVVSDNMGKDIHKAALVTDEWGVANTVFSLPEDVSRTGNFVISERKHSCMSRFVRVEQYKRPTFVVSIDDYKDAYKTGDTITVTGRAKTYAGVPVQNAKVAYTSNCSMAHWWSAYYRGETINATPTVRQEAVTGADGTFLMRIPIEKPDVDGPRRSCFYSVNINAEVTSLAGESHTGNLSLPLGDAPTALVVDGLPEKVCLEQLPEVVLRLLNNAGQPVEQAVAYDIDGGERVVVLANEKVPIDFASMKKGAHTLNFYCNSDSVSQKFVLFSLEDKAPVIETNDWFYDTVGSYTNTREFKAGEPVHIQLGTSRNDQIIFYAIVSAKEIVEEGSFVLSNANMNRAFYYKEEWGDGIAVRYSWVRDGKIYTHHERLHKPEKDTSLQLEWSSFRDKLVPGQKEEWTLKVKNPDGTPAKAHMIATLYDKSLDALSPGNWSWAVPHLTFTPTISSSQMNLNTSTSLYGEQSFRPLIEPELSFYHVELPSESGMVFARPMKMRGGVKLFASAKAMGVVLKDEVMMSASANAAMDSAEAAVVEMAAPLEDGVSNETVVRENLNETAAFLPELVTDKNGNISIKFTLPESLTTWRFVGLAHDKEMNNGVVTGETVVQKQLMVQPNMPRFIREGDEGELSATITNTTKKQLSGTTLLTITNAETNKQVFVQKNYFTVKADATTSVSFAVPSNLPAEMYVVKIVARSGSFSDGEQHYMPILSQKEIVTTTRAVTQTKPGQTIIDLDALFGKNTQNEKVTIEYTNNPAWLMIDALPAAVKECKDEQNAVSLSTALYAATLSRFIKSNVSDVELDADTLATTISALGSALKTLQNADGSFSWWPSMPGNTCITVAVARNLIRLDHLIGPQTENTELIRRAMNYLAKSMSKEVASLKKIERESKAKPMPSETAMDYLYLQSLCNIADAKVNRSDVDYLFSLLKDRSKELTIYGKANLAVAFACSKHGGSVDKAKELLESAIQYSVATEEMGRYFDTSKAHYSWRNYKIPTETAAIEALQIVRPEDVEIVAQMRQWLLNEKRTQQWDTPINTTSAVYAFLNGNLSALKDVAEPAKITLDKKVFNTNSSKKGYFKTTEEGRFSKLVFDKSSEGMSWGAVFTEALQPVADVENDDANQLKIVREILGSDGKPVTTLTIGQKVTVRLTITAGRDYDFLEVTDNRPACLEPANQLSGYRRDCYVAPGDSRTSFYIDQMPKGKRVIETEYFVDRAGTYQSGLATVRCAYAPEFSAREKAYTMNVK